jgi:sporulation integral membrane protein YtvI
MEEYRNSYLKKYDKMLIYFVVYTIVFFIFVETLPYTIPFVLAFFVAAIVSPMVKKIIKWTKNRVNDNLIVLSSLLIFYGIIGTLITALTIRLVNQTVQLITNTVIYINNNYDNIVNWFQSQYDWIVSNIQSLDPGIVESGSQMLGSTLNSLKDVLVSVGKVIGGFALDTVAGLPNLLLVVIFTVVCSFFFTKKFITNPGFIYNYLPTSHSQENRLKNIITEGKNMVIRYGLSYLLIILITGVISIVGYLILGIPYALILGIITAFLDLMPILGVSAAYVPIAIYYFSQGNVTVPIGLGILWIIVAVGRNIWEPRIVASSLDINPVITIAAIFIGLKIAGITGMFFLIFMAVGFKVLQTVGVLDTFSSK